MNRFCLLAAAMVWGMVAVRAAAAERICPRVSRAPKIDGTLDDAAWTQALRLTDFTLAGSKQPPAKAIEARLCFDRHALYAAFVCAEPQPQRIRAERRVEADDVWKDDCVEVWIRSTDSTLECDQFICNTLGVRQSVRRRQRRDLAPWRPKWQPKVRVEARRWVVEMRIPFSDLDMPAPKAGEMIQLKLGREDRAGAAAVLSGWPAGSAYGHAGQFASVYFERDNLLANADMSEAAAGKVKAWSFHKSDAGLFAAVAEGDGRAIRFRAPGRYTTASQSLRLKPNARYRLEARVKGTAGIYLRARTAPKAGAATVAYTANVTPAAEYRPVRVPFPTGPTGEALILLGNTEGGGAGDVYVADLRVVQEPSFEVFGPAIPVEAGAGEPTVIRKLLVADCRALRGFVGTPVDGTTRSGDWSGGAWEYNQRGAGAGVGYAYRANDGLHVGLADDAGFHAVLIRGGARVRMYRDCPRYDDPAGGTLLAEFPGLTQRCRAWFDEPVRSRRVSFFDLADGRLADVSFFRVQRGAAGLPKPRRWRVAGACDAAGVRKWLNDRFDAASRATLRIAPGPGTPADFGAEKGKALHLLSEPLAAETPLAAIALDFVVADAPTPVPVTLAVQDPLNPKSQLFGADVVLSKPGRCRVVMDFPDQVVPEGATLWLTVTFGAAASLKDAAAGLYAVPRDRALPEALAYRKLLLKTYFASLSEPRPWNGWYDDRRVDASLADPRWGPQLQELIMTLQQCKHLGPADDLVRQYDQWTWRQHRQRRASMPAFQPRIDQVPGAPEWAVVARQAWLTARQVPAWWLEHRCVPTGELGGEVGDDTDMYQNYADFVMFETGGVAAKLKDAAARLAELAERENLTAGLNRRSTDPLHAYEEGVNHEALLAWWNYGEPVYLERCIVAARSTEALTVVTPKGHRHFKSQQCGAADLRMDRKTDADGHAHPLMWHPTFEVAWYHANPRALKHLRQWADGWLDHMAPGKYATSVEVAAERVTETTSRPLSGGYGSQGSAFLFLYWITDDARYLGPFLEAFGRGSRNTSPGLILPELIHRHGLGSVGDKKLRDLVRGEGVAETIVTGDKRPLIEALKADIAELQRFGAMYTTAEPFTDRVFLYAIRNAAIAYTGGYASRNKYNHTHAVSWEGLGTDYAALVLRARRDALKVLAYNFADRPLAGRMRVWTLDHGVYDLRVGRDGDGDDRMDEPQRQEMRELLRASGVPLSLPPRQVTVIELQQAKRLDDERLRADLALSSGEIRVEGGVVRGVAHNIGSRAVESFEVALVDAAGKVRARKTLGPLAAPLDLVPKRLAFALPVPPAETKGWSVALDPDERIAEIHEGNNRAALPSGASPVGPPRRERKPGQ